MINPTNRYATPTAFRAALTERLRAAAHTSKWTLQQLQRQVAYDRLLERLYLMDNEWIVKGATALLARNLSVRASLDVDIYRKKLPEVLERDLRDAVAVDIDDWFKFEVGLSTPIAASAVRLPVTSTIGNTIWVSFHVDLVGFGIQMTGEPDAVLPLVHGLVPYTTQRGYRVYPLVDHIADKVAAMYELYGSARMPSTRYRDLIDLVAIIRVESVLADHQRFALKSEFNRRNINFPKRFELPECGSWERGYAIEARRSLLTTETTLEAALAMVSPFLNPLFDCTAFGSWNPLTGEWSAS